MGLKVPPSRPTRAAIENGVRSVESVASEERMAQRPGASEDDEIVPVDHFLVFLGAEPLLNLGRFQPFDLRQRCRGTIYQTLRELLAVRVKATDRIAGLKGADDLHDT